MDKMILKDGDILHLRVTPKASSNRIKYEEQTDGSTVIRVYVTCVPEDGKANDVVIKLLSKEFSLSKSTFVLKRGHKNRDKIVMVQL